MDEKILKVFYEEIIEEASFGKVDAYFTFNIAFNTIINQQEVTSNNTKVLNTIVPTLIIKDKKRFDEMLLSYAKKASIFYDSTFYDISYGETMPEYYSEYIKSILTLVWSNATSEDFANPINYLRKRINHFDNLVEVPDNFAKETSIGLLTYEVCKDQMFNETPYYFQFYIDDYPLPVVRFGTSEGKAYIYAIQNITKLPRNKKLNRAMYKVNEGLDVENEPKDNIENPENIVGITLATLISAVLTLGVLKNNGYNDVEIKPYLPSRWNVKEIAYYRACKQKQNKEEFLKEQHERHIEIQRNLTDKFLRTFRRLEYHLDGIVVTFLPYINSENMMMQIGDEIKFK